MLGKICEQKAIKPELSKVIRHFLDSGKKPTQALPSLRMHARGWNDER
jgi:hypothetical protein